MKVPNVPPEAYNLILDEVLSALPQGYTFTREAGPQVRYTVAYNGETLLQITAGKRCPWGGGSTFGIRSLIIARAGYPPRERTPEEWDLISRAGAIMQAVREKVDYYATQWGYSEITPQTVLTLTKAFEEHRFAGTPYDFGALVSDFSDWYYSQEEAWTSCAIIPQQTDVTPDMPHCSVELSDGESFLWLTTRRLPGGDSKLAITGDRQAESIPLNLLLRDLLQYLEHWGYLQEHSALLAIQQAATRGAPVVSFTMPYSERARFLEVLQLFLLEALPWRSHPDAVTLRGFSPTGKDRGAIDLAGLRVSWEPGLEVLTVTVWRLPDAALPDLEPRLAALLTWLQRWGAPGEKTVSPTNPQKSKTPRPETLRKAAMVRRVIALWNMSKTQACKIVGIKSKTYNDTLAAARQEDIQTELALLTQEDFDAYLKRVSPTERGDTKNLYALFWSSLKQDHK